MRTVGNDLVRHQLHENRKWYIGFGILFILCAALLLISLPFATLSAVIIFGALMMFSALLQLFAAFKFFDGALRWVLVLFAILYALAGYYAWTSPIKTAIVLTNLVAIFLIIAGVVRLVNAILFRNFQGWGWTLLSGLLTLLAGIIIFMSPDAPAWVLGLFLAMDILFQGINYLGLASYIRLYVPKSSADR
ncbi:HdeD family acid-resistance protein [Acinetobacter larvae]|uniref:HdeD family acid-resistance protein n=1 Tax=Acinetobacter larvae TaxID=1789224 RepID=A0A1B2LYD1_9GAMM|nr:HdeD family acid-resistance protein [Acinetobacter larvae]AOA57783.1 hypothetical protein BFG52_05055 [Acinetobacter larvae]